MLFICYIINNELINKKGDRKWKKMQLFITKINLLN